MKSKSNMDEDLAIIVAACIAEFMRDADPYEFRDNMGTTETDFDAQIRITQEIYSDIMSGKADALIDFLMEYDFDSDDPLARRRDLYVSNLREFSTPKTISKNLFKIYYRRK